MNKSTARRERAARTGRVWAGSSLTRAKRSRDTSSSSSCAGGDWCTGLMPPKSPAGPTTASTAERNRPALNRASSLHPSEVHATVSGDRPHLIPDPFQTHQNKLVVEDCLDENRRRRGGGLPPVFSPVIM